MGEGWRRLTERVDVGRGLVGGRAVVVCDLCLNEHCTARRRQWATDEDMHGAGVWGRQSSAYMGAPAVGRGPEESGPHWPGYWPGCGVCGLLFRSRYR